MGTHAEYDQIDAETVEDVMLLRPICNEEDYETALAEIEMLWQAEDGTPEGDQLDLAGPHIARLHLQ